MNKKSVFDNPLMLKFVAGVCKTVKIRRNPENPFKKPQKLDSGPDSPREEPGGLENVGSNCYMNAIVQALASSDTIVKQFRYLCRLELNMSRVFAILEDLIESINSGQSTVHHNTLKLKLLREKIKWKKTDQQDAFELLCSLVNGIHQDLMDALPKEENFSRIEIPLMMKVIHKDTECNCELRVQNQVGLSVGLCGNYDKRSGVQLEYLIEQTLMPMEIDGDPSNTIQMFYYEKVPEILVLHIQANKWDSSRQEMVKPTYYIIYQEHLVLDLDICSADDKEIMRERDIRYGLTAVVNHMGSAQGGHYVTYRKHKGQWFLANDSSVERIEFSCDICPYILIYEKQDHECLRLEEDHSMAAANTSRLGSESGS